MPRPRTLVLAAAAAAAVLALASGAAGPPVPAGPGRGALPGPRPAATPTAARLDRAELDRQDRLTRRQRRQQQRAQAAHALLEQLPLRAAGATVAVAGIEGDRTALWVTGRDDVARQLLSQALVATGDDPDRYQVTWDTTPADVDVDASPAVRAASAYALAASTYGPASSRTQQRRARRLAVGALRRPGPVAVVDDTQITVLERAELVELVGRYAAVELDLASQRRRAGALQRSRARFTARLLRDSGHWRVEAFSVNAGSHR